MESSYEWLCGRKVNQPGASPASVCVSQTPNRLTEDLMDEYKANYLFVYFREVDG